MLIITQYLMKLRGLRVMKIKLTFLLLILCISSSAYAIPVTWSLTSSSSLAGSYDYDVNTNLFSNVLLSNAFGDDDHFSLAGNAQVFGSSSVIFGDVLTITLAAPMTNAGGTIAFTYTDSFDGPGSGTVTSGGSNVSVPEPASVALLGLGILGLGWTRRRTNQ